MLLLLRGYSLLGLVLYLALQPVLQLRLALSLALRPAPPLELLVVSSSSPLCHD